MILSSTLLISNNLGRTKKDNQQEHIMLADIMIQFI